MSVFLAIAVSAGILLVGIYAGIAIYAYRVRLKLAWNVLLGTQTLETCNKQHVKATHEPVERKEWNALKDANTQLTIARGLLCFLPPPVQESFKDAVNEIVRGQIINGESGIPD